MRENEVVISWCVCAECESLDLLLFFFLFFVFFFFFFFQAEDGIRDRSPSRGLGVCIRDRPRLNEAREGVLGHRHGGARDA